MRPDTKTVKLWSQFFYWPVFFNIPSKPLLVPLPRLFTEFILEELKNDTGLKLSEPQYANLPYTCLQSFYLVLKCISNKVSDHP
jgi:hypothetical protein